MLYCYLRVVTRRPYKWAANVLRGQSASLRPKASHTIHLPFLADVKHLCMSHYLILIIYNKIMPGYTYTCMMNMEIYFQPKTAVDTHQEETLDKRDETRTTIAITWVVFVFRARQVPVSNLALGTGYPDRDFSLFSSVHVNSGIVPHLRCRTHPPITNPRHHYHHLTQYRR
jgi:hypothetical protein